VLQPKPAGARTGGRVGADAGDGPPEHARPAPSIAGEKRAMTSPHPRIDVGLLPRAADTRIGADPQHQVRGVPGQLDDLVSCHARHGRTHDRSGQPVARFDELVLGPLVVLEGDRQSVRCHATQHAVGPRRSPADGPGTYLLRYDLRPRRIFLDGVARCTFPAGLRTAMRGSPYRPYRSGRVRRPRRSLYCGPVPRLAIASSLILNMPRGT
jgi:hypothetical protein